MQIAIISDVHNNEINLTKVLNYCIRQEIKTIICCGDLASREILEVLNDNFSGTLYYTFGNADYTELRELEDRKKYRNTFLFKEFGEATFVGKSVAFVHYPHKAKKLAESGKYNFVFYGHTHKPWEEIVGNCKMLNPGNVSGEIYLPTFAVWDTQKDHFRLLLVHNLN